MKDDERRMEMMYEARMSQAEEKVPYALYPTGALCPEPYTLYPTPLHAKEQVTPHKYLLKVKVYTLYTLHPTPYTLHPTPYTLHPTLYTLHPTL